MQTRVLYMTFKNTLGNSCTITVDDPRDDIEEQEIIPENYTIKIDNCILVTTNPKKKNFLEKCKKKFN